jgi:lipopolysaccharide transport system ATP-binding protein
VLFVSHQLNSIMTLCNNCILLNNGVIKNFGITNEVIAAYLNIERRDKNIWTRSSNKFDSLHFSPLKFKTVNIDGVDSSILSNDNVVGVYIEGEVKIVESGFCIGFALYDSLNNLLFWSLNTDKEYNEWIKMDMGINKLIAWIPPHFLNEGEYRVELITAIHFKEWLCQPEYNSPIIFFSIKGGLSNSPHWTEARPGILAPINTFQKI